MATLQVDVVSAEESIFSGEAKFVALPGEMGERFQLIGFSRDVSLAHAFLVGDLSFRL